MSCWLNGKTCVVTGASGGMGAGIAAALIKKHGCRVIGIARNEFKMQQFVEELGEEYAKQFSYYLFDVSRHENWKNFAQELAENDIKIDVLVNNAGILPKFKRTDRYRVEEIETVMNINFYSAVYSTKELLPQLLQSDSGAVINIDSSAALMSLAGTSAYSASKAALKAYTKTDIMRNQSAASSKGQRLIDMISTDCDLMVKMIMFGIEHKQALQVHGMDAHAMSIFGKLLPVSGSRLFSAVMKAADIDIFSDIFKD